MDWQDEGIVIATARHGEHAMRLEVLTAEHGRHAGLVPGGAGRRMAPHLQPGACLKLAWRARLEEHLGTFRAEPLPGPGAPLEDARALAGLASVCALLRLALAERVPMPALYARSRALIAAMAAGLDWPPFYVLWELHLLEDLGYGLDLSACAVTGQREGLVYVSPRSGRAVSREGAGDWGPRLLALPGFCLAAGGPQPDATDVAAGLTLTGHFLSERLVPALGARALPAARGRLLDRLAATARPREAGS